MLCSSDINPALLDALIRGRAGAATATCTSIPGLSGIDFRRVQALPIAHQPLLYVESPSLSPAAGRAQAGVRHRRRVGAAGRRCRPVLAAIALLIKLEDRGPVLFRQQRVGRDGVEFGMLKFRSMCVDAEARLAALRADQRAQRARCSSWTA